MPHSVLKPEGEQEGKSKKNPPKAISLYLLDLSIQCFKLFPNLFLLDPVCLVLRVFPNYFKILFFKNRIKEQKLRALEIKVQCIPWLYSC